MFRCFFCSSSVLLILWPVCCVMCSYKFSQYDTAASILLFMKCIGSTLQAQAEVDFRYTVHSRHTVEPLAIKACCDGSFFMWKSAFQRRFVEMQTNTGLRRYFITPLMILVNGKRACLPVRLRRTPVCQFLLLQPFAQMRFIRKYKYILLNEAASDQHNEMLLAQICCRRSTDVCFHSCRLQNSHFCCFSVNVLFKMCV